MKTEQNQIGNTCAANGHLGAFLREVMLQRHCLPTQLAADLGLSHATVSRWLSGQDKPSLESCRRLAECAGTPVDKVLAIAGYLPPLHDTAPAEWPEFREYALGKYPHELDEDLVAIIEDFIQSRRSRRLGSNFSLNSSFEPTHIHVPRRAQEPLQSC